MKEKTNTFRYILKCALIFSLVYVVSTIIFTMLMSFVLLNTNDPLAYISYKSKGISLISTFVSGFALAQKLSEGHFIGSIILGFIISCILLILSLFVKEEAVFNPLIYIFTVIAAIFGSTLGKKRSKHRKSKHKRK